MDESPLILICDKTQEADVRKACKGSWMGFSVHHHFFAWQRDLSDKAIRGRRIQRVFDLIVNIVFVFFGSAVVVKWFVAFTLSALKIIPNTPQWLFFFRPPSQVLLWFSIGLLLFVVGRIARSRSRKTFVLSDVLDHPFDESVSWETVKGYHGRSFHDISYAFTKKAIKAIDDAVLVAHTKTKNFSIYDLLFELFKSRELTNFLIRFELPPKEFLDSYKARFIDSNGHDTSSDALWKAIAISYVNAADNRDPKVGVFHLFEACMSRANDVLGFFEELGVQPTQFENGIEWFRFNSRFSRNMRAFKKEAIKRSSADTGAAMTGLATPLLNAIGEDLTRHAQWGRLAYMVDRDKEMESLLRIFESGARGAVIVGEIGVGKRALIAGLAERMVEHKVPEVLRDKRLVIVPIAQIVGGESSSHQARLMQVIAEARKAGNVILGFEGIEGLAGVRVGGDSSQDLADTLAELMEKTGLMVIATTSQSGYGQSLANSRLSSQLKKVDLVEVDENTAIQILESRVGIVEAQNNVWFTYEAIEQCVEMSARFLQDTALPEKAIALMRETAVHVRNKRGSNQLVRGEDVGEVVTQKTDIPTTSVGEDESEKLLKLEKTMHERVIGQDEAVKAVAAALRRARTDLRSGKRPIATFLFLGPTGVGKTETAKTLAQTYFGGEERMVRFDMSEFQDSQSVYRLIGQPGAQGTGLLTEAVRQNPFTLLLLDEFEKADSQLLNVFLQVMDDGRLTDSVGRVVDFTNTIIIATSNAGSQYIQEAVIKRVEHEEMKEALFEKELKESFRPELLNRFDGVIVFTPLSQEQIEEIAHLMIDRIGDRLYEQKGIRLEVTDKAVMELAKQGYSPEFGARPMRRVLQSEVEDKLAEVLLKGEVNRNQTVIIDVGGKVNIE